MNFFSLDEKRLFQKNFLLDTFFSQFVLSHASNNSTSQNIGGTEAWAVPPPQFFWGRVPILPPKSPPMSISALLSKVAYMTCPYTYQPHAW